MEVWVLALVMEKVHRIIRAIVIIIILPVTPRKIARGVFLLTPEMIKMREIGINGKAVMTMLPTSIYAVIHAPVKIMAPIIPNAKGFLLTALFSPRIVVGESSRPGLPPANYLLFSRT